MIGGGKVTRVVDLSTIGPRTAVQVAQALAARVTFFTTIAGARAAVEGMQYLRQGLGLQVYPLQELHASLQG